MNQPKHTNGPWVFRDGWTGSIFHEEQCIARCCEPQSEANARRIVACVNACEGADTKWLESMAKAGGFGVMNQYISAYNQAAAAARSNVLEADKKRYFNLYVASGNECLELREKLRVAREALEQITHSTARRQSEILAIEALATIGEELEPMSETSDVADSST